MQPGNPETVQEKAVRLAQQAGAAYPEAVAAVLQPFEGPTAAGTSLFANVDGQIVPYEAALATTRDKNPTLSPLFSRKGKLDVRLLTPTQYRLIRGVNPELFGMRPR
jgi:hypothetical protein